MAQGASGALVQGANVRALFGFARRFVPDDGRRRGEALRRAQSRRPVLAGTLARRLAVVLDFVCEELCGELLVGERVREPSGLIARRAVVAGNGDVFFGIRRRRVDAVR